jgi:hypothetical protein
MGPKLSKSLFGLIKVKKETSANHKLFNPGRANPIIGDIQIIK